MNKFWDTVGLIRGKVVDTVCESGKTLIAKFSGRGEEVVENREVFQQYGFQSRARNGSEVIALRQGNLIVVVGSDNKEYRMSLEEGAAVVYSDNDNFVRFKGSGGIEVKASSDVTVEVDGDVNVNANNVTVTANSIKLGGNSGLSKLVKEVVLSTIATHTHKVVTDPGPPPTMTAQASVMLSSLPIVPANKTQNVEAL